MLLSVSICIQPVIIFCFNSTELRISSESISGDWFYRQNILSVVQQINCHRIYWTTATNTVNVILVLKQQTKCRLNLNWSLKPITPSRNRIDITAVFIFISWPTSPVSLTIAKQYICGPAQKNPDKIRISGLGVKNKPKIRICQSGTDRQTLHESKNTEKSRLRSSSKASVWHWSVL